MSGLDCNTPTGRVYIEHAKDAIERMAMHCRCNYVITDERGMADIDCLFFRDFTLRSIAEVKTRNLTKQQLISFGSYLITGDKIDRGALLSERLQVPFFVIVKLITDNAICYWKITDNNGIFVLPITVEQTKTQATCNGGEANRFNAFLPVSSMKTFI